MHFEPGIAHTPKAWTDALWSDESFFKSDVYVVVPPGTGSSRRRVSFSYAEQHWTSKVGTVHLEIDPNEPWAGLVPDSRRFPGQASHFVGGLNLAAERLPVAD